MTIGMRFGFADESGSVTRYSQDRYLIVAIIVTAEPRRIAQLVHRAQRSLRRKPSSGEMKAATSEESVIRRMLRALADENISVVIVAGDRDQHSAGLDEPERFYRQVMAQAVRLCVVRWPELELVIDKRYTTLALRTELEKEIRRALQDVPQQLLLIRQEDSHSRKELQAADFIAWAFGRKYNQEEGQWTAPLRDRVMVESIW